MITHIVHGWLSYCTEFLGAIGYLTQATEIDDVMVAAEVFIRRTANRVISGKDYYAMLHAHTTVLVSLFNIHLEALARCLINQAPLLEKNANKKYSKPCQVISNFG